MTESIQSTLMAFRDVEGVEGSFLLLDSGAVIAKALPAMFDDASLSGVGPRIVRLCDALSSGGDLLEQCLLRFAEHKVFLKMVPRGVLCVLTSEAVNMPALKMASNLAARRIAPELAELRASWAPSSAAPAPATAVRGSGVAASVPPVSSAPPVSKPPPIEAPASLPPTNNRTRIYRGHRVG